MDISGIAVLGLRTLLLGHTQDERDMKTAKVTRFEVIDHRTNGTGRAFTAYDCSIQLSLQDDGRTLKVFVDDPTPSSDK